MFFFFQQKTAYDMRISDWSSDVCSSDLQGRLDRSALLMPDAPLSALTLVRTTRQRSKVAPVYFEVRTHRAPGDYAEIPWERDRHHLSDRFGRRHWRARLDKIGRAHV